MHFFWGIQWCSFKKLVLWIFFCNFTEIYQRFGLQFWLCSLVSHQFWWKQTPIIASHIWFFRNVKPCQSSTVHANCSSCCISPCKLLFSVSFQVHISCSLHIWSKCICVWQRQKIPMTVTIVHLASSHPDVELKGLSQKQTICHLCSILLPKLRHKIGFAYMNAWERDYFISFRAEAACTNSRFEARNWYENDCWIILACFSLGQFLVVIFGTGSRLVKWYKAWWGGWVGKVVFPLAIRRANKELAVTARNVWRSFAFIDIGAERWASDFFFWWTELHGLIWFHMVSYAFIWFHMVSHDHLAICSFEVLQTHLTAGHWRLSLLEHCEMYCWNTSEPLTAEFIQMEIQNTSSNRENGNDNKY